EASNRRLDEPLRIAHFRSFHPHGNAFARERSALCGELGGRARRAAVTEDDVRVGFGQELDRGRSNSPRAARNHGNLTVKSNGHLVVGEPKSPELLSPHSPGT